MDVSGNKWASAGVARHDKPVQAEHSDCDLLQREVELRCTLAELNVHREELLAQNDVLEATRAELAESLAKYSELYDDAPVGYVSLDRDGIVSQANHAAAELFVLTRSDLVGRSIGEFVSAGENDQLDGFLANAFANERTDSFEMTLRTQTTATRIVRMKTLLDPSGTECRVVLFDVTSLRQTELRFSKLAENIEQAFWVADQQLRDFVYISPHWRDVLGTDCNAFANDERVRRAHIHHDDFELHDAAMQRAREGEPLEVEYRVLHPDKGLRWLRARSFPFIENGQCMSAGLLEDITERREAEQARLNKSLRLRDALTREVHHRIKNNLQTVVGLLRREAGKHPETGLAMEDAIAQVLSIAVVHGLYGRDMQRTILLCELLPAVVNNVADLTGRTISREGIHEACGRLLIRENETVAVALILNELITNAVKHAIPGQHGAPCPLVRLSREGARGFIRIANPGQLSCAFDYEAGMGLGTGLNLLRALTPTPGMSIRISQEGAQVVVDIVIEPPVVTLTDPTQDRCKGKSHEQCLDRR